VIGATLTAGVLAGLDNLQVCSSLGLLRMTGRRRHCFALAFTFCETAAPLLGILAGNALLRMLAPVSRLAAPAVTIVCGIALVLSAFRGEDTAPAGTLFGLPVSLSLDNVAAGMGISPMAHPAWAAALVVGATSAAMSCAGLYGAALLRPVFARLAPVRAGFVVGGYLCLISIRLLWKGAA